MTTFIIAEVATTWLTGPDPLQLYADLANTCARLGLDAMKTQWVSDPARMAQRRTMPEDTYSYLAWEREWFNEMAAECTLKGVEFMCTSYLPEDVAVIDPYVKRHKVASLEAESVDLIEAIQETDKPLFLSTGCWNEWELAPPPLQTMFDMRLTFMQCTAAYPCVPEALNLQVIRHWSDRLRRIGANVGFSDHSCDPRTGMLAVACGARYLEVHVRHDLTLPSNPDYSHSLTVAQLSQYVENVRFSEAALGDGVKKVEPCEEPLRAHRVVT